MLIMSNCFYYVGLRKWMEKQRKKGALTNHVHFLHNFRNWLASQNLADQRWCITSMARLCYDPYSIFDLISCILFGDVFLLVGRQEDLGLYPGEEFTKPREQAENFMWRSFEWNFSGEKYRHVPDEQGAIQAHLALKWGKWYFYFPFDNFIIEFFAIWAILHCHGIAIVVRNIAFRCLNDCRRALCLWSVVFLVLESIVSYFPALLQNYLASDRYGVKLRGISSTNSSMWRGDTRCPIVEVWQVGYGWIQER